MKPTCRIIIDKRRIKKATGTYPIKLKITQNRISSEFATIFHLSIKDYSKLSENRISCELQGIKHKLREILRTVENYLESKNRYNLIEFRDEFLLGHPFFKDRKPHGINPKVIEIPFDATPYIRKFPIFKEDRTKPRSLASLFARYIQKFVTEGRIGTALNLQSSYFSLKLFDGDILLSQVTPAYLFQYERWMLKRERSLSTIGIVTRNLRTIYNEAIARGLAYQSDYPFGKRKYLPPQATNIKKALTIEQISQIYYYKTSDQNIQKARDFWLFCYFANGISPKDLLSLKFRNIKDDFITFHRSKTIFTSRPNIKLVKVFVNSDMSEIIKKWGNACNAESDFLFPILKESMSQIEMHFAVKNFIRYINATMRKVGQELGISQRLTTIVCRHSFSTQLKRSGISTEFIQEALGHIHKSTTECYLDTFEDKFKKTVSRFLVDFKRTGN